jgi:hypothetical protein
VKETGKGIKQDINLEKIFAKDCHTKDLDSKYKKNS